MGEDVHDDGHEGRRLQAAAFNPIWTVTKPPPVGNQTIRTLRMAVAVTFEYVFGMINPSVCHAVWLPSQPHIQASLTLALGSARAPLIASPGA
jgi:hypothetical protein